MKSETNGPEPALVLASESRYRRALMDEAGLSYRAVAPGVDESPVHALGLSPRETALRLAQAKADALVAAFPGATIIGADQVADVEGEPLHKPGSHPRAAEQLRRLSGRTHHLTTALAVRRGDVLRLHVEVVAMTMRALSDQEIEDYLLADRPYDCAGSYKYESLGRSLFVGVDAADPTAIIGTPMKALRAILAELGP